MTVDQALAIVEEHVKNENLIRHMRAVGVAMAAYAEKYSEDSELWEAIGILHDFDWEIHPTLEGHPSKGADILRETYQVDEEIIQIILSHAPHTGVARDSLIRKVLFACDEITGLLTACAYVRPSKSILDLKVKSIKKKFKDKNFAAGVNRDEVQQACEELGVDLWTEHVPLVLTAMQGQADLLGLRGSL